MDREGFTTGGTYQWSFVTQMFRSGLPSHGGDSKSFELMTQYLSRVRLGDPKGLSSYCPHLWQHCDAPRVS